jgi:branched-chain amino acid aminotransferase
MDAIYFHDGQWLEEQPRLIGPRDHAFWMASVVFDGARAYNGLAPDVDMHCERLAESARNMLLAPTMEPGEMTELCLEAVRKLPREGEYYIRPMYYGTEGFIIPEPESTKFVLAVYESPMPEWHGMKVCMASVRRPSRDQAPTTAKASCLYPNSAIGLRAANARGFDNAIVLDPNGNVAELLTANLWIVKDGVAMTPAINGTFLNGVTRRRVIDLLKADGIEVRETTMTVNDVMTADEVFSTGNYGKVLPIVKVEDRDLQPGPVTTRARDLYFDYSNGFPIF